MKPSFSPAALVLLFSCAVALFALSVLLHGRTPDPLTQSFSGQTGANSYSRSAIGYLGLYDTMDRLSYPVSRSVGDVRAQLGGRGTLMLLEPTSRYVESEDYVWLAEQPRMLLVLRKWLGKKDENKPQWIDRVTLLSPNVVQGNLAIVDVPAHIVRAPAPQAWTVNSLGIEPEIGETVQLLRNESGELTPLIASKEGILLGELKNSRRRVLVLSDPDILNNHGIDKGNNLALALKMIDSVRSFGGAGNAPLVFDEKMHGFFQPESTALQILFRFPYSLLVAVTCLFMAILAWSGCMRFGVPIVPARELDFGKRTLIRNSAHLLDYSGHHADVLNRYIRLSIREAGRQMHAPRGMPLQELAPWLDRIGTSRDVSFSCSDLLAEASASKPGSVKHTEHLMAIAANIHRWKGELLNGSRSYRHYR